jgi:hypothetical protein
MLRKNQFRVAAITGTIFLILSVSLFVYSTATIQQQEATLNSPDISLETTWQTEGAIRWWRNAYATVFLPLTVILATLGTISLVSQPLLAKIHQKTVLKNFADNIKRNSAENYN